MTQSRYGQLRPLVLCLVLAAQVALSGCATLYSNRLDDIRFDSAPQGADILLDGRLIGRTPLTYAIERTVAREPQIQLRLDGYTTHEFTLQQEVAGAAWFNTISTQCWSTDAASGAMYAYSPGAYFVELRKPGASADLQRRALRQLVLRGAAPLATDLATGHGQWLDAVAMAANPDDPASAANALLARADEIVLTRDPVETLKVVEHVLGL